MNFSKEYWDNHYMKNRLPWDIGYASTPLKEYFDQLTNRTIKILVPGAGIGWEAKYLYDSGFTNTYYLDYSTEAIAAFKRKCPEFPDKNIIQADFFKHNNDYDLIVEQTFFSSLYPEQRNDYVIAVKKMLKNHGKLVGVLFNHWFDNDGPPFGGTENEYIELFNRDFLIKVLEEAYNSILPRKNRELFILIRKKS